MIPRWVRSAVGVLTILVFAFAAREVPVRAVLVILVGGLAGLLYLVTRSRGNVSSASLLLRADQVIE